HPAQGARRRSLLRPGQEAAAGVFAHVASISGRFVYISVILRPTSNTSEEGRMPYRAWRFAAPLVLLLIFLATPAHAQQTGSVAGRVFASDGSLLPGVVVDARSPVLPGPRTATTSSIGAYSLAALPPGEYTVTFTLSGMSTVTKTVTVLINLETAVDVK